jgi:hypothetical protein
LVSTSEFDGPAHVFDKLDTDGDGYLSEDEAPKGPPPGRHMRKGKKNHEGKQPTGSGLNRRPPRRDRQDGSGEDEKPGAPHGAKHFIERLDLDGDGLVSRSEFDGPAHVFDKLDADGDGYLSEDEAPKGPPPGRRMRKGKGKRNQQNNI